MAKKAERLLQELRHARRKVKEEKAALRSASASKAAVKAAQEVAQEAAKQVQQRVHDHFGRLVTRCLEAVFEDESLEFRFVLDKKRGKTEARPAFFDNGVEVPRQFVAGGVKDVAAFALRLAKLSLDRPARRRLLVLDEPFKHVNGDAEQGRVAELVLTLAKEFGVQILIVTDDQFLKVGKVIEVG